jgi:hypothetical protein
MVSINHELRFYYPLTCTILGAGAFKVEMADLSSRESMQSQTRHAIFNNLQKNQRNLIVF